MARSISLQVPDDVYDSLSRAASVTGRTTEDLVLDSLARTAERLDADPLEKWIGAFRTGIPDLARDHDRYLAEALEMEMRSGDASGDDA